MNEQPEYMNFPELSRRISELVDKLNDGSISRRELDELTSSTLALYDRLVVIRYNTLRQEVQAEKAAEAPYSNATETPEASSSADVEEPEEMQVEPPAQSAEREVEELREEIEHEVEMPGGSSFQLNFSQISPNQISLIDSIEEISREEKTRNESLSQDSPTLAKKLRQKPIADLKSAIGINQRFLFTSELFEGNTEAFNEALTRLNSCNSFLEADDYIENNLAPNYHWDMKNNTVKDFLDLVQRRYL